MAVTQLERVITPVALKHPQDWLFLIETGPGLPGRHPRDQYSLATSIGRRLRIPVPERPFLTTIDEEVIDATAQQALPPTVRPDDLYGALCYDFLPKKRLPESTAKSLESARIHEPANPRLEAVELIREFNWHIEVGRLTEIVAHVLHRIDNECLGMLEEFYDLKVRPLLDTQRTSLNRHRLQTLLRQYPEQHNVLVMIAEHHLPLVFPSASSVALRPVPRARAEAIPGHQGQADDASKAHRSSN